MYVTRKFSPNRPTGPIRSSSRHVHIYICPLKCVFLAWTESAFSRGPSPLFGGDGALMGLSSGFSIKTIDPFDS